MPRRHDSTVRNGTSAQAGAARRESWEINWES
jgi:hypothetical protein